MPNTYVAIQTITVGSSGQANIEFTNIPQTYTDLCILLSARDSRTNDATNYTSLQINGNTSATVKYVSMVGAGSSTIYNDTDTSNPASVSAGTMLYASTISTNATVSGIFGNSQIYFSNYTGSNNKSVSIDAVNEHNASSVIGTFIAAGVFQTSSPITSIKLGIGYTAAGGGGTYQQYSSATLYGIKKD